ncbi:MAG: TolC family protein [Chamaesiphon sp.]|nr:TolC family protein [Chamaesiphon sp.]
MLILIKLVHTLNQRIDIVSNRHRFGGASLRKNDRAKMRFQAICAVIALSLAGLGRIEVAQSQSLDFAGIRQSLELTANPQSRPELVKFQTVTGKLKVNSIAQTTPPPASALPAPTPTQTETLKNRLDLPSTGAEIQITNTQALTLQETLAIAFRNNRDVQVARLTIERSQAAVTTAQAAQALQVGLTANASNQGAPLFVGSANSPNPSSTQLQGGLQATYPLFNAGRDASSVRAAEEQVNFDKLDLLRVEQLLRGNVTTAYYNLQAADSSVIINQASVRDATRSLSDAQLQEKAGVGTKFDILTAQVQLANANQALTTAIGQQFIARKGIAQLLSVSEKTEYKAADPVVEAGTWRYSLEDSIIIAFKNRPEIKQQLVRRNISQKQEIVSAAADSAQGNLFANYNIGKDINSSFSAQDNYSLGLRVSWNFLDGGAARSNVSQQKVNQQISENQLTTARNQIRNDVEQAFSGIGTNRANIATATTALRQSEESLKLARLRFQAGVGTQTDVINAQTVLANARGNRVTAILNYNRALSNLQTATLVVP